MQTLPDPTPAGWGAVAAMIAEVRRGMLALVPELPPATAAERDAVCAALAAAAHSGAQVRVVVDPHTASPAWSGALVAALRDAVHAAPVPTPLLLCDSVLAAFPTRSVPPHPGPTLVTGPAVAALAALADACWAAGSPWPDDAAHDRQAALIELLMAGCTDAVIAARLGVTERSVRRWVADLSARHGVRTRLQLGAALARAPRDPA